MEIKILGTGCAKCAKLEALTREVAAEAGIEASIAKVEDVREIMQYVMMTPALVVNGNVEVKGRLPSKEEVRQALMKYIK